MNKQSSIKKNFTYQMLYEILILILPFVTSPYVSRVIGADGLGSYSFSYTIANYFLLFSMLGIKNYGNRAVAQVREKQKQLNSVFSNILFLHIIVSAICCIAYIVYLAFVKEDKLYAEIQFICVISGLFDISWFYFGIEKFKLTVTRNMIIKIINVICIFVFVRESHDLWKYCLIMSIGMLISQLSLWIPLKSYTRIVRPNWQEMKRHIVPLLILFIPVIAVSLYRYMDKIMIGALSNKTQLGYYENSEKVANIPMTIITSFGTVMLPKMSNLITKNDKEAALKYIAMSMKYVMWIAFALAFGLAAVGKVFAPVFWGENFTLSGSLIMGLAITIPFMSFANVIRTQYLIPNEKDKDYLVSVISGAVINLIINYLLIPRFGAGGATIGTIVAEIIVCLVQTWSVRNVLELKKYIKSFWMFFIMGIGMFGVVYTIGQLSTVNVVTLMIQIVTGVLLYGGASLIYFIKEKDKIILNLLRKVHLLR